MRILRCYGQMPTGEGVGAVEMDGMLRHLLTVQPELMSADKACTTARQLQLCCKNLQHKLVNVTSRGDTLTHVARHASESLRMI